MSTILENKKDSAMADLLISKGLVFSMVLSGIVPFQSISVNTGLFDNCQLLCVFEVRSLLPVTLSEYCAELFCAKRCLRFLK